MNNMLNAILDGYNDEQKIKYDNKRKEDQDRFKQLALEKCKTLNTDQAKLLMKWKDCPFINWTREYMKLIETGEDFDRKMIQ